MCNVYIPNGCLKWEENIGDRKIFAEIMAPKLLKSAEEHLSTHPRNSVHLKANKCKDSHSETLHDQTVRNWR